MMRRIVTVGALFALLLSGCAAPADADASAGPQAGDAAQNTPSGQESEPVNPQKEALAQAEQAGLLPDDTLLDEDQAQSRVAEALREGQYAVSLAEDRLSVGSEDSGRKYYIFDVRDDAGELLGQVAIDSESGKKYNYLGNGVLEDYDTFPLYDASAERTEQSWQGVYADASGTELEISQSGDGLFDYRFSDGTAGSASVSGSTARSSDGAVNFLCADRVITVAGGHLTGN